ncbi:MAG: hypothetical protein ACM3SY_16135 [Candidatus Omnitrophota bacterium]
MGAFFLYQENEKNADNGKSVSSIDRAAVNACFEKKGFTACIKRRLGAYTLLLYRKMMIEDENFIEVVEHADKALYAVGTLVYKGLNYRESLRQLLDDFTGGRFDFDRLIGSFFVLIRVNERLYGFTDRAGIQNIYYCLDSGVLSSSFLAVVAASPVRLHLNKLAVTEVLTTGNLVGPDTLIHEIKRVEPHTPPRFHGLRWIGAPESGPVVFDNGNHEETLGQQIELLNDYFKSIKPFADHYGLISGITGGLDSRLLLIVIKQTLSNYRFFSTWRKIKTREFSIAESVCKTAGVDFISIPYTEPLDMDEHQARDTLHRAFLFMDGHVRAHHFWHEAINTRDYRSALVGEQRLGMNGVGGEQYRNEERMIRPRRNFKEWVAVELVYKYSGDCFNDRVERNEFLFYLGNKIKTRLNLADPNRIGRLDVKRYFNEVYNPANRTVRTNMENQCHFCLSPYTDYTLATNAYRIIPHLGVSREFEGEMIKRLDPVLAAIPTHYGEALIRGEPLYSRLMSVVKELTPVSLYGKLYHAHKSKSTFYRDYVTKFPFIGENTRMLEELRLPLNPDTIKGNALLGPLVISMGHFLDELKTKING